MRQSISRLSSCAAIFAAVLFCFAAATQRGSQVAAAEAALTAETAEAPAVAVVAARQTEFEETILVTGSLAAREQVLVTPQIEGYRIEEIFVEEGDTVEAGQKLAKLADAALRAQLARLNASLSQSDAAIAQARSQIAQAEATLKQANAAFERARQLLQSRAGTQANFDEKEAAASTAAAALALAKDGLKVAEAGRKEVEAQIVEAELRLGYTEIAAPRAGKISRRNARTGGLASSVSEPLFHIIADSEIELEAEVPEIYLPRLSAGQAARIEAAGLPPVEGRIRLISPEVDRATRLGKVRIFIGRDDRLRVGAFARATINTDKTQGVGVPSSSVFTREGTDIVLVVKDNRVETRKVATGIRDGANVQITDGLQEGELVVLRSGALLRNGDAVRPVLSSDKVASENL